MKLIVGLGNPEDRYAGTRHNLGFVTVDEFRRKINAPDWTLDKKFQAELSKPVPELLLARPQTYMNMSGLAVFRIASFFKIKLEDIVIVHDELDLLLGQVRIRKGGSGGGHHGVESVIDRLGTDQFLRVRLGIGNLRSHAGEAKRVSFNAERFVLEQFDKNENHDVTKMIKRAVRALGLLLAKGLEETQNQFH